MILEALVKSKNHVLECLRAAELGLLNPMFNKRDFYDKSATLGVSVYK